MSQKKKMHRVCLISVPMKGQKTLLLKAYETTMQYSVTQIQQLI